MHDTLASEVRKAYSQDKLAQICLLPEAKFGRAFGMETVRTRHHSWRSRWRDDGPADYYHFRDNGSRVLAVAHLDTVVRKDGRTPHFSDTRKGPLIRSGALDDRLGAYVILQLLPAMGITCDWLLTTGEESCASTAGDFTARKDYDWLIEFDRMATDVVMYQYECAAGQDAIEAAGAQMGHGSFSDVAALDHLGVLGFNWGVGYRGNYHSEAGYAYLEDTFAMVAKYLTFHEQNAGLTMPHEPWLQEDRCGFCGHTGTIVSGYCTYCGVCEDCGGTDPEVAAEWGDEDVDVCQCYVSRREAEALRQRTYTESTITWEQYMASRPAVVTASGEGLR